MMCLALLDPDGTSQRQSRRLKRHVYRNKVNKYFNDINLYWSIGPMLCVALRWI